MFKVKVVDGDNDDEEQWKQHSNYCDILTSSNEMPSFKMKQWKGCNPTFLDQRGNASETWFSEAIIRNFAVEQGLNNSDCFLVIANKNINNKCSNQWSLETKHLTNCLIGLSRSLWWYMRIFKQHPRYYQLHNKNLKEAKIIPGKTNKTWNYISCITMIGWLVWMVTAPEMTQKCKNCWCCCR